MKKVLLIVMMLVLTLTLIACGNTGTEAPESSDNVQSSNTESTGSDTSATPSSTNGDPEDNLPEGERVTGDDFVAVKNDATWTASPVTGDYAYFTTGVNISSSVARDYAGYTRRYFDAEGNSIKESAVRKMGICGASVKKDDTAKTVDVTVHESEVKVQADYKYVRAKAGAYLMFKFTTNVPGSYAVTVSSQEGTSNRAEYLQTGISVTGKDGTYTGIAKCTVPYRSGKTYYINICSNIGNNSPYETASNVVGTNYPVYVSIPVEITPAKYDSQYSLMFQGDWELVKDKEYLPNLIDLFYNTYPRLYARFGTGTEPKQITFVADKTYDGVAYCQGTRVVVATDYANSRPDDLGFFSHEITHSVQQYSRLNYGGDAWWTENMANYGGFRYFHWGYSTKFVQIYSMSDTSLQDWGYQAYGNNKVFFAYMDARYPTTIDENGKKKLGLIDSINKLIKTATTDLNDNPRTVGSPFNNVVKEITGYETMEALRLHYVEELKKGTWAFVGFRDYTDNFLTENIPGVPNPKYPMLEPVTKGDKTNELLSAPVTEGTNLALNAKVLEYSGQTRAAESIEKAFDGSLSTKWAARKNTDDHKYELGGYQHGFIIDLGEVKTFNTYTMIHAGIKENSTYNAKSWEILVSVDGENWVSVDYQPDVAKDASTQVSVNIGEQSARYVQLRYYACDRNNVGTARLYEFMLFNQQ